LTLKFINSHICPVIIYLLLTPGCIPVQVLYWDTHFSRCFAQWYCWARRKSSASELETFCGCIGEYWWTYMLL